MSLTEEQRLNRNAYMREWQRNHAEQNRAKVKAWRKANPEKRKAQARKNANEAYARDPEKFRARSKARRDAMSLEDRRKAQVEAWGWQKQHPSHYLLYNAKYRARQCGLPCTITVDDIVIPDVCPVLGIPLIPSFGNAKEGKRSTGGEAGSPSLDKIIPEFGYVPENIMVISHRANSLKRDSIDPEEHRAIADYIERETTRVRRELG